MRNPTQNGSALALQMGKILNMKMFINPNRAFNFFQKTAHSKVFLQLHRCENRTSTVCWLWESLPTFPYIPDTHSCVRTPTTEPNSGDKSCVHRSVWLGSLRYRSNSDTKIHIRWFCSQLMMDMSCTVEESRPLVLPVWCLMIPTPSAPIWSDKKKIRDPKHEVMRFKKYINCNILELNSMKTNNNIHTVCCHTNTVG